MVECPCQAIRRPSHQIISCVTGSTVTAQPSNYRTMLYKRSTFKYGSMLTIIGKAQSPLRMPLSMSNVTQTVTRTITAVKTTIRERLFGRNNERVNALEEEVHEGARIISEVKELIHHIRKERRDDPLSFKAISDLDSLLNRSEKLLKDQRRLLREANLADEGKSEFHGWKSIASNSLVALVILGGCVLALTLIFSFFGWLLFDMSMNTSTLDHWFISGILNSLGISMWLLLTGVLGTAISETLFRRKNGPRRLRFLQRKALLHDDLKANAHRIALLVKSSDERSAAGKCEVEYKRSRYADDSAFILPLLTLTACLLNSLFPDLSKLVNISK